MKTAPVQQVTTALLPDKLILPTGYVIEAVAAPPLGALQAESTN